MFRDAITAVRTQDDGPYIHRDVDHEAWDRAARLLEAVGGRPFRPAAGTVYRFITPLARDHALHLVRSKIGWTVATPFDGTPRLPGNHPGNPTYHNDPAAITGCFPDHPMGSEGDAGSSLTQHSRAAS